MLKRTKKKKTNQHLKQTTRNVLENTINKLKKRMKQENNKILKKSFLHSWLSSLAILAIYYNVYDDVIFKIQ